MAEPVVELKEEDVESYKQQFRMAVRSADDRANKKTGFDENTDPLLKNKIRADFLLNERIDSIMDAGLSKGYPGYLAAANALRKLANELMSSTIEAPSREAPAVKVIKKTPAPS